MYYGHTIIDVRGLIDELTMLNNIKIPDKIATNFTGIEYLYNLRNRDNQLSLRIHEDSSMSWKWH